MRTRYLRFTRVYGTSTVESTIDGDSNLPTVLEEFKLFLLGCGYPVDGELVVEPVSEEDRRDAQG